MVQEADTYLTPELRASVGTEVERMVSYSGGRGRHPALGDRRLLAGDAAAAVLDEAYAQTTPFRGIHRPAEFTRFLAAGTAAEAPTRWRRGQRTRHSVHEMGATGIRTYGRSGPGDVITFSDRIARSSSGRSLGRMLSRSVRPPGRTEGRGVRVSGRPDSLLAGSRRGSLSLWERDGAAI